MHHLVLSVQQEKFVQEALARQMPPVSLAGAMYPGIPMPMYGATPGMPPMMHVAPVTPPQAPSGSNKSGDESDGGNYVQQLQSEYNSEYAQTKPQWFFSFCSHFYF